MDFGIKGKKALVMASSKGIGKGIAQALVREGVRVAVSSRNEQKLKETAKEIGAELALPVDLSKPGAVKKLTHEAVQKLGGIDILVTSSGSPPSGPFSSVALEVWQAQFEAVWLSAVEAIRAVLSSMRENRWGRVVMVNSIAGKEPIQPLTISNGIRSGLLGLMKSLSLEVASLGITVNAILPGWTRTEGLLELHIPESDLTKDIPAKRLALPEELGALAVFLCSQQASYITGQAIACDGGFLRGI